MRDRQASRQARIPRASRLQLGITQEAELDQEFILASDALKRVMEAILPRYSGDEKQAANAAQSLLYHRLQAGFLRARSEFFEYKVFKPSEFPRIVIRQEGGKGLEIPAHMWMYFSSNSESMQLFDYCFVNWANGDFSLEFPTGDFANRGLVNLIGVSISVEGLPLASGENLPRAFNSEPDRSNNRGRPPANWWPDFAEELAVYIHAEGFPPGSGGDGQEVVINAVFERMTARGKTEGGRSTVQPVVRAVLERLRAPG